jgi:hypothetical protein
MQARGFGRVVPPDPQGAGPQGAGRQGGSSSRTSEENGSREAGRHGDQLAADAVPWGDLSPFTVGGSHVVDAVERHFADLLQFHPAVRSGEADGGPRLAIYDPRGALGFGPGVFDRENEIQRTARTQLLKRGRIDCAHA